MGEPCQRCGHVNVTQQGEMFPLVTPPQQAGLAVVKEKPKKELTPLQRLMLSYKIAKGIPKDSAGWDKANFARYSRPAKSLLECFGGSVERAVVFLLAYGEELSEKGLSWTLDTVARHAWDRIGQIQAQDAAIKEAAQNGLEHRQMGATPLLEQRGHRGITRAGDIKLPEIAGTGEAWKGSDNAGRHGLDRPNGEEV